MNTLNPIVIAAAASLLASPTTALAQDAVQWTEAEGGNGHWYQFVFFPGDCIEASEDQANALGASLVTIHSDDENALVDSLIPNYSGSYSVGRLGAYQDENAPSPDSGWNWITGEPWNYTAWSPHNDQPNDGGNEPHVVMYASAHTGKFAGWHDNTDSCGEPNELGWIIEWSADCNSDGIVDYGQILDGSLADGNGNGVPDICEVVQWRTEDGGNGHWYAVIEHRSLWTESVDHAQSIGGDLASINSAEENALIRGLVVDADIWCSGSADGVWLGGHKPDQVWIWTDGSVWDFVGWCEGGNGNDS
ncbi:MAG: C-type lectin domain-containing protein, partial [Phycisphaerales bacterium]|nr:C-type lectin domain-containing protein [Phycisphaerales bacterium]